jgi:hypothetical protein
MVSVVISYRVVPDPSEKQYRPGNPLALAGNPPGQTWYNWREVGKMITLPTSIEQ